MEGGVTAPHVHQKWYGGGVVTDIPYCLIVNILQCNTYKFKTFADLFCKYCHVLMIWIYQLWNI